MKMKRTIIAVLIILTLTLAAGLVGTASAMMLNPGQFPYSIFEMPDLMYMGSNTGTMDGVPCALEAAHDNVIPVWFNVGGFNGDSVTPSYTIGGYCVYIYPFDPSEVVNTAEYLSSSQKNYIGVSIEDGPCMALNPGSIKPAADGFWSDHLPGLTTATANPMMGMSMIKLQDSAIISEGYSFITEVLSAAGFRLDKKGFWTNQCFGQPMIFN